MGQLSFMNPGGLRADLVPDEQGLVRYGQLYAVQPFGNQLVVKTFTGAQIKAALEQQFASGSNTVQRPRVLLVSAGFSYRYDLSQPVGARISHMVLNGTPLRDDAQVRVVMSSYLDSGGDNFTVLAEGRDRLDAGWTWTRWRPTSAPTARCRCPPRTASRAGPAEARAGS